MYTILSLGCSFLVYRFFLRNQKTFQFNRFFLLGSLVLCLLAPLVEIKVFDVLPSVMELSSQSADHFNNTETFISGTTIEIVEKIDNSFANSLFYGYIAIALLFLLRYILNLFRIIKWTQIAHKKLNRLKLISFHGEEQTSSFFNYVFMNSKRLEDKIYTDCVIRHERVHCEQLHSLDILLVELLCCAFWFNPFVWLYKKQIQENHEFIADEAVVQSGVDIETYSYTIINSGKKNDSIALTSGFNFIHIKNRLIMLHQSKSTVFKRTFKSVIAVLLFGAIFTLSSFKDSKPQFVVVVDAGHGGEDPGNLIEKDVVLQISNRLALYGDRDIKIVETRPTDNFLSLKDRVKFINALKPDLVISLHTNAHQNAATNGVEAFYSDQSEHREKSHMYSKILVEDQLTHFSVRGEIKTADFYILKNVEIPAVILELGFITNEQDKATLTSASAQDKIAKSLYDSLLKIRAKKAN